MQKSKKYQLCEKDYIWNPDTCSCENIKSLGTFIVDSMITCDEIIEEAKAIPKKTLLTKVLQQISICY